jgi:hypothetical protein
VTDVLGLLKSGVLNRLKNSARNWILDPSVIRKFFIAEKSMRNVPGPYRMFRPALPKVPGAARAKASVMK